jgi:hypothetical protein
MLYVKRSTTKYQAIEMARLHATSGSGNPGRQLAELGEGAKGGLSTRLRIRK